MNKLRNTDCLDWRIARQHTAARSVPLPLYYKVLLTTCKALNGLRPAYLVSTRHLAETGLQRISHISNGGRYFRSCKSIPETITA